jgi:hypothetical protein
MDSFYCTGQASENYYLQHEEGVDVELHATRTCSTIGANGVHLS